MKVIAVSGSARRSGNTHTLLKTVCAPLESAGHEVEIVELAGKDIRGCIACGRCRELKDGECHGRVDDANAVIEKVLAADIIILGSPTYFADISPELKALIDRAGYVGRSIPDLFARKLGAGVVAVRRAGAIHALDSINHFFLISEMIVVGSSYWNIGIGRDKGDVESDAEGMGTMSRLGENLAWTAARLWPDGQR